MIINLTIFQMLLASLIPLLLLVMSKKNHYNLEKRILRSSIKMTVQLVLIGYILIFIFDYLPPVIGCMYIFIMQFFAIRTFKSQMVNYQKRKLINGAIGLLVTSFTLLLYFMFFVVNPDVKLNPQYVIPLYGMMIGNSLTALVLIVNTLDNNLKLEKRLIMSKIHLGMSPSHALEDTYKKSLATALSPILTSMLAIGLVALPGMMTGQILSGVDPLLAIKYQIAIMFAILGGTFFTTHIYLTLEKRHLINQYHQVDID